MMRIDAVSSHPDRVGKYKVSFSDGSVLRLYRQTVEDFGIYTGKELSEEEFAKLKVSAGEMSAKMRAVRIVAASNVSRADLKQRLINKGETVADATLAVSWMSDMDLVDDKKTAEMIVARCIEKGYGVSRVKQALFEKRIPKELWEDALADYPDQTEKIMAYLKVKLTDPSDTKAVRKVTDALIRRGHSFHQIRSAMQQMDIYLQEDY